MAIWEKRSLKSLFARSFRKASSRSRKQNAARNASNLAFESLENRQLMAIDLVADIGKIPNSSDVREIIDISTFASRGMAMSAYTNQGLELVTQNDSGVRTIHTWPNTDLMPMELTHFQDNIGQSWVYFSGVSEFSDRELFRLKVGFNEVTRVKDINLFGSSDPKDLTVVGNTIYFTAWTSVSGRELWKTDGTSAGTVLVEDLKSGFGSGSNPEELTKFGNLLLFTANDGVAGRELWISGGTASSTFMVKDVNPGIASSNPRELTVAGDKVFFSAFNRDSGREVWKSDGISTSILKNLSPGTGSSNPEELTARNSQLFFTASLSGTGRELYWYEPTVLNDTLLVKDIFPGTEGSNPKELTVVDNNLLYFSATSPTSGTELWKSNGFTAGTVLVKDLRLGESSSSPHNLVAVGNRLYFAATHGSYGIELFKSDGTATSTSMVRDINKLGFSNPKVMTSVNGQVAFSADNGKDGREVWMSSGTAATTTSHDVFPGTQSSSPTNLTRLGNDIYFIARASTGAYILFRANADNLGTATEIATGDSSFTMDVYASPIAAVGDNLYFMKRSFTGSDRFQLLKYTPSTGVTTMLKELSGPFAGSRPHMIASGNRLYCVMRTADDTYQLWTSDGTVGGTLQLKSGTNFTKIELTTDANGRLYFRARVGIGNDQLWRSLGTNATTLAIPNLSNPGGFMVKNDQFYFSASDGMTGNFYRINMTNAPAIIRANLYVQFSGVNFNGTMYFYAYDYANPTIGYQLWKSNGTASATSLVKVINDGGLAIPTGFSVAGGTVFFIANSATSGRELYKTDGTDAGTVIVKNIGPSSTDANIELLATFNDNLYFRAFDGTTTAIWKSNGTPSGTTKVTEINNRFVDEESIYEYEVLAIGSHLYFSAVDELFGQELFAYHI